MLMFNYLFLSETYEPVVRDACPRPLLSNFKKLDFWYRSMLSNDIFFNIISFFLAYQFLNLATFSGPLLLSC